MSEMIERAAKAMCASQLYGSAWDGLHDGAQETYRANARAAFLAALDPEDEALVDMMARTLAARANARRDEDVGVLPWDFEDAKALLAAIRGFGLAGTVVDDGAGG